MVLKAIEQTGSFSDRFIQLFGVAPSIGLQGALALSAAAARNTKAKPFFQCNWLFLYALHITGNYCIRSHSKGKEIMVNLGGKTGTNPHSADQNHRSLSPVCLTERTI